MGVKSRECYEQPAALALITAHRSLEDMCLEREVLHYKLGIEQKWAEVVYYGQWFPSSRLCRECGCVNAGLELGQAEWTCPECGAHHERDAYAAETIQLEGLRIYQEGLVGALNLTEPQGLRG